MKMEDKQRELNNSTLLTLSLVLLILSLVTFAISLIAFIYSLYRKKTRLGLSFFQVFKNLLCFFCTQDSLNQRDSDLSTRGLVALTIQACLPWPPLLRSANLVVGYYSNVGPLASQIPAPMPWILNFLAGFPDKCYVSIFALLWIFWWRLYSNSHTTQSLKEFSTTVYLDWAIFTAVEFTIWAIILILMAVLPDHKDALFLTTAVFALILNFGLGILFLAIGLKIFWIVRYRHATYQTHVHGTIIFLAALCASLFIFHSLIIVIDMVIVFDNLFISALTVFFYDVLAEFLPTVYLLCIIHWPKKISKPLEWTESSLGARTINFQSETGTDDISVDGEYIPLHDQNFSSSSDEDFQSLIGQF